MNTPKGMTEEQVIEQITIVVNRIAPKYTFKGYDVDDIKQEAFMICMDALHRYDCKRPLENFLSVNLSNRLKNFVRDNYFVKNDEDKKRVLAPKQLSSEDHVMQDIVDHDSLIDIKEIKIIIDRFLPSDLRSDYLKMISDVYIPKKRKVYIVNVIKSIIKENGYA